MKTGDANESSLGRDLIGLQPPDSLAGFLEMAFEAVVMFDAQERITYWNPAAEQMYGWKAREALRKTPAELFWPARTPQKQKYSRLKRGEILRGKHKACRKDGSFLRVQYATRALFAAKRKLAGYLSIYREITTQEQTSPKTIENGRKFSLLLDKAGFAAALSKPPKGIFVDVNEAWVNLFGYTREEAIGKTSLELNINPDVSGRARILAQLQQGGSAHDIEGRLQTKSGEWRSFLTNIDAVEIDGQKYFLNTVQDITERKRSEQLIKESEDRFRIVFDQSPIGIGVYDADGVLVNLNQAAMEMFGISSREKIVGSKLFSSPMVQEEVKLKLRHQEQIREEIVYDFDEIRRLGFYETTKSGVSYFDRIITPLRSIPADEPLGYLSQVIDITKRKHAEEQLEHSNQKLSEILASIQDDFFVIDRDWNFVYANKQFTSKLGKEPEDLIGNNVWRMFPKHVGTNFEENLRAAMEKRETRRFEIIGQYTEASYKLTAFPSQEGITVLGTDITESKRVEEALQASELRYRTVADNTHDFESWIDPEGKYLYASPSCKRIYGREADEFLTNPALRYETIHPDDRALFEQHVAQEATRVMGETEFRIVRRDGTIRWVAHVCQPVFDKSGNYLGIRASNRDITDRKEAEEALRASEERLRKMIETSPVAIGFGDSTGKIFGANTSFYQLTGYSREEIEAGQLNWNQLTAPEYAELDQQMMATLAATGSAGPYEKEYIRKDGRRVPLLLSVSKLPEQDEHIAFIMDMTERNRTRQQIFESNQRLMALMNALPVGVSFSDDPSSQHITGNPAVLAQFEVSSEDNLSASAPDNSAPGRQVQFFRDGKQIKDVDLPLQRAVAENREIPPMEFEVHLPSGRRWWASGSGAPIHDQNGNVIGGVAVTQDITERKHREEQLWELSQRLTYHVDNSPLAVIEWGPDMRLVRWSGAAERMFGWKAEEVLGKRMEDLHWIYEQDVPQVKDVSADLSTGADSQRFSANRNYRKDGSVVDCEWYNSSLMDDSGHLRSILSLVLDVTDRKRAEQALLENQKELQLLNETLEEKVHEKTEEVRHLASDLVQAVQHERHRISHILHDDLQQRIYAIQMQLAFLHDELQNESARKEATDIEQQLTEILAVTRRLSIDLSPPILRDEGLSHAIDWLAAQMRQRYGLSIELQANEPFAISDEALHVLLFNCVRELLFNVVKHAQANRAVVTLKWVETDLLIEVRDDGKGFLVKAQEQQASREGNEENDLQSGFGLTTIRHQLSLFGGYMEIQSESGAGTRVILIVPVAENR